MSELWPAFGQLLSVGEFVHALGLALGTAMMIGGLLSIGDDGLSRWGRWAVVLLVYVVLQEIARSAFLPTVGDVYTVRRMALVMLTSSTYVTGLLLGALVVRLARRRR